MNLLKIALCILWLFPSFLTAKQNNFTDADLNAYLSKNPKGIIYIVSPHMYLSLKGLEEYEKIAATQKLPFLVLIDPMATTNKNMLNIDLSKYAKLDSKDIISRDSTQHYPSYIFYKNGKLEGGFNPGYDAPEKFTERLNRYFRE